MSTYDAHCGTNWNCVTSPAVLESQPTDEFTSSPHPCFVSTTAVAVLPLPRKGSCASTVVNVNEPVGNCRIRTSNSRFLPWLGSYRNGVWNGKIMSKAAVPLPRSRFVPERCSGPLKTVCSPPVRLFANVALKLDTDVAATSISTFGSVTSKSVPVTASGRQATPVIVMGPVIDANWETRNSCCTRADVAPPCPSLIPLKAARFPGAFARLLGTTSVCTLKLAHCPCALPPTVLPLPSGAGSLLC